MMQKQGCRGFVVVAVLLLGVTWLPSFAQGALVQDLGQHRQAAPGFVQVQEELQKAIEHDAASRSSQNYARPIPAQKPVKAAPGYIQVDEPLKTIEEHDSPNRKTQERSIPNAPAQLSVKAAPEIIQVNEAPVKENEARKQVITSRNAHTRAEKAAQGKIQEAADLQASTANQMKAAHVKAQQRAHFEDAEASEIQAVHLKEEKAAQMKRLEASIGHLKAQASKKLSTKLPSKHLGRGVNICVTPECAAAAAQLVESMDITTRPCDDFFQFACGGWVANHPLPGGSGSTGTFSETARVMNARLYLILESPAPVGATAPQLMTRDLYATCMDTDQTNSLGLTPLVEELAKQGGWPMTLDTWNQASYNFYDAVNYARDINVSPILFVGLDLDITNTSRYILYIDFGNVPLGYQLMQNPGENTLGPYRTYITEAAKLVRNSQGSSVTDADIAIQVEELIAFEIAFSKAIQRGLDTNVKPIYYTTISTLQAATDSGTPGAFDWMAYFRSMFSGTGVTIDGTEPVISFDSEFWPELSNLLAITSDRTMANYLAWNYVYDMAFSTTYEMKNLTQQFVQNLTGVISTVNQKSSCRSEVNSNLGFALSRDYIDLYFPPTGKTEVTELVEDIRAAYRVLMQGNTWMLPDDLVVAIEKLDAIDPFIAYPDWIMNDAQLIAGYEGLVIKRGEHLKDLVNIGRWYNFNTLSELRTTPVHSFLAPPTIVNAFYNPQENTITILAGILQTPFYAHNSLAAINYGAIGMVIGHEMTHGFDNTGRLFDKDGNLRQWWSNGTVSAYLERAQCFVDQYDAFIPPELTAAGFNISVNGVRTEGENIADNGGIREAFQAYQRYVARYGEEPRLPGLDEFTPDQLFYLGYANVWCENNDAQSILTQIALDPHSPGRFRVLGPLQNDAQFSRVWNCPAGAPMNRGPESCLLW